MKKPAYILGGWGLSPELLQVPPSALHKTPILFDYGLQRVSFDDAVSILAKNITSPIDLCAWSFGGLLAIALAYQYPEKIASLVLLASQPRFLEDTNWSGITNDKANTFLSMAKQDFHMCHHYFLSLVQYPSRRPDVPDYLNQFTQADNAHYWRHLLNDLFNKDLREMYSSLNMPILHITGSKDAVLTQTPSHLTDLNPNASVTRINNAGHACFLTHKPHVSRAIEQWLTEH